jgi:hypothetical protein
MASLLSVVEHNPAKFRKGDTVKISVRFPIGHYRVPQYLRGQVMTITEVLGTSINPEEEAFGRNAGNKIWLYRLKILQKELWPEYQGNPTDIVEIEIYENWLENM